jgi:SPX domain protein involved in polyphosphate accumulation
VYYENLPIYRSAMNLIVYIETIVKGFEKYHKYTIGVQLRERAQELLFLIAEANMLVQKHEKLYELRNSCERFKMSVQIAKELKAFRSFKQFEQSSRLAIEVCKQSQAWLKSSAGVSHVYM